MRTYQKIKNSFLEFYSEHGHQVIGGSSLIPPDPNDPVLYVTSGMHPLIPYLEGKPHPQGRRLVNCQDCLRTTDLDEVGDPTHLTYFQMLGSWSLGDYSKTQSLKWGYKLLTEGFGIPSELLSVTVWEDEEGIKKDLESYQTWESLGISPIQLTYISSNWWGPKGKVGVCGPDSEIFVWTGQGKPQGNPTTHSEWMEIWNHVFMEYNWNGQVFTPLVQRNVDTGMGLERLVMYLQGVHSVFDTDIFKPWQKLKKFGDESQGRILMDHFRTMDRIIREDVYPSNTGRGYVLRKIIRRSLKILRNSCPGLKLGDLEIELEPQVVKILQEETVKYDRVLKRGEKEVQKLLTKGPLGPDEYTYLYETYGIPKEVVKEILNTDP